MQLKQIIGYEHYFISDEDKIFSDYTGILKAMSPYKSTSCHYLMIKLSKNGTTKMHLIHRLVAETFISNPLNLPEVNHKDKNTTNNKVDNLNWCTHKENLHESYQALPPERNVRSCKLFYKKRFISDFKSVSAACKYAQEKYNASYSSLRKYLHVGCIEIIRCKV